MDYSVQCERLGFSRLAPLSSDAWVAAVFEGASESLAAAFGRPGPFLGRHYLFWHENRPLSLIYEVFSPALAHFLGPPRALADESPSPPAAEEAVDRGPRESGSA